MGRNARRQKYICSDGSALTDNCISAHNCSAGINRDSVFKRRMALLSLQQLACRQRARDEANALIHLDVVANDARFPDNGTGAMIHKKV